MNQKTIKAKINQIAKYVKIQNPKKAGRLVDMGIEDSIINKTVEDDFTRLLMRYEGDDYKDLRKMLLVLLKPHFKYNSHAAGIVNGKSNSWFDRYIKS